MKQDNKFRLRLVAFLVPHRLHTKKKQYLKITNLLFTFQKWEGTFPSDVKQITFSRPTAFEKSKRRFLTYKNVEPSKLKTSFCFLPEN